MKILLV
ncbi:Protein of unknown function [Gryllus bimaculatus]|nr:Protein of unknown function [Gryllus bimaculatus]